MCVASFYAYGVVASGSLQWPSSVGGSNGNRDSKSDADKEGLIGRVRKCRHDADHLSSPVEKGATRVAGVHRGIELDQAFERESVATALDSNRDNRVVLENVTYYAPTNKRTMKFKKEISQHRVSDKKQLERLTEEFKSMDREL